VAVAAGQAQGIQIAMDMMTHGASDAVLDRIRGTFVAGIDGDFGGVTTQAIGCHLPVATVIAFLISA